ncbi:MAG: c-type cytochrome [Planctomycetota bacterium]|nr:c-type cytochrome [Planctomycetota bacterium]
MGADATGKPHPQLGASLQSQAEQGLPEAGVSINGWEESEGTYADGTVFRLRKPRYEFSGVVPEFYSVRLAPPLIGQGLLEAVEESTGTELALANSGRLRIVTDPVTSEPRWGRFGWKGGQSQVKYQIAVALNNDMGVTTSIYPQVDRGSEQTDRGSATRLSDDDLDLMYRYVVTLGVPPRRDLGDSETMRGEELFTQARCATCHVATLRTSPHHPLAELRNQTIHPYSDLLLHDLGEGLADNMGDGTATAAQWRTTPLWGIGLTRLVGGDEAFLHDGRARSLSEAILWHGGEAQSSRESYREMPAKDRAALVKFLESL